MLCTKLLSPIENINDFQIIPMVDIGDFVVYKKISNKEFFNSVKLNEFLKIKENSTIYIEPNEFFISSNKVFNEEFEADSDLVQEIINSKYFNEFKLKELKNLQAIIQKEGEKGSLITIDKNPDSTFEPYYVFVDPYVAEAELNYLITTPFIKNNLEATAKVYENMMINLKKANETFLDKNSQVHYFVNNVLMENIQKVINDIENAN
ncbi:hypothetical protein [Mycoplasma enhydrae]|uniref:hypothetical protein n=1 Tax=Mycoplasma enhydrae TaxID=2499220 RepID=UPI00197BFBAF|nr:hypothetical protein [Mycoplasma enhydrae]MBN4089727.1 hypothetical protein [Mycoplasma enhydrae]